MRLDEKQRDGTRRMDGKGRNGPIGDANAGGKAVAVTASIAECG